MEYSQNYQWSLGYQNILVWKSLRWSQIVLILQGNADFPLSDCSLHLLICYYKKDSSSLATLPQGSPYLPAEKADFVSEVGQGKEQWGGTSQQQPGDSRALKHPGNALTTVRGFFFLPFHEGRKNYFKAMCAERGYKLRVQGDNCKQHRKEIHTSSVFHLKEAKPFCKSLQTRASSTYWEVEHAQPAQLKRERLKSSRRDFSEDHYVQCQKHHLDYEWDSPLDTDSQSDAAARGGRKGFEEQSCFCWTNHLMVSSELEDHLSGDYLWNR